MNRLTATKTFYDKGLNPRNLIYRGESFPVSDTKGNELIRSGLARSASDDYEKKIVEPETKENPESSPNPETEPAPVEEKQPEPEPEPEPESKYEQYTVDELKKMIRDRGIIFPTNARKADLIAILEKDDQKS